MSEEIGRLSGSKNVRESLLVSAEAADQNKHEIYEFGPFRLEPAERKLLRGCEVVALTPKVFDMLVMLVRNNGHLLEKDELIQLLWPDSFVEEGNLSNNVFMLRKALGNDHEYIETVTSPRDRFDVLVIVSQCLPQHKDIVGQVAFLNERVWPEQLDKLILFHQVAVFSYQHYQHVEYFGRQGYNLAAP